jgi:polyisoprenoid-binding protein YceI
MKRIITVFLAGIIAAPVWAGDPVNFHVNDELKRDIVTFTSKAPMETVVGKTGEIIGFIEVDPTAITNSAKALFEVDLASLETGIGLRDNHMRKQYLEVGKYPKAVFRLTEIKNAEMDTLKDNVPINMTLTGDFTVHGVTKQIDVAATVTYLKNSEKTEVRLPGDLLHVVASFDVYLSDHNIKRPQFIILKLDDLQKIHLDFFASTEVPPVKMAKETDADKSDIQE